MQYAVIGKYLPRLDGTEKATGQARFGADVILPGLLWGKLLRSPHAHARLLKVDTSQAERLPGVKGVVTAQDVRPGRWGNLIRDEMPLAREVVRWVGDRIAAVAATDPDIAEEALSLIQVEYEPLPAVLDLLAALEPEAPLIHEELEQYSASFAATKYGNVCSCLKIEKGEVERGFAQADIIWEDTFRTPMANQAAIEPSALLAAPDASGKLTVWVSTQSPFNYRTNLADILGLPLTKVRVIATHVGGGFGGKGTAMDQAWASLLALKTGRPVRAVYTREDDFIGGRPRHPSYIQVKLGAKRDGTLVAGQGRVILDTGASAVNGPNIVGTCSRLLFMAYRIPNLRVEGYAVYTNKPGCSSMRAPGSPQACFAIEQMMDTLAEKLGMDPLELRLKNAVADRDVSPTGQVFGRIGLRETLRQAREASGWDRPLDGKYRGRGMASGIWHTGGGAAACQVKLNQDGSFTVSAGSVDIGQGSTTAIAQIVAEELGVGLEDITMVTADTDTTPHDTISAGSSVTHRMGNAARRAAQDAKAQLLRLAAERLEANVEDLEAREGRISVRGTPQRSIAMRDLARASYVHGSEGPVLGRGSFFGEHPPHDPSLVRGMPIASDLAPSFITEVAEVEVDPDTGEVKVLKLTAAQDVGQAINRLAIEGQIVGGAMMGLGFALTEAVHFDEAGRIKNPNFLDYKLPTSLDQPPIDPRIVEVPSEDGPFGVRGAGEPPLIAIPAAISNAIYNAVGVRIKELPLTGEKILAQLREKGE